MKVTVLVNVFNGAKTLDRCIKSILNQSYENCEIILWDNQSTDNTKELIRKYDDIRLRYFYAPVHTCLYDARNQALKHANGDLVAILDIDDWWVECKLEKQVEFFNDQSIGLVYSNFYEVNEKSGKTRIKYVNTLPSGQITKELVRNYIVGSLTIMYRRTLKVEKGLKFNPKYNHIGDFDFVVRLSEHCNIKAIQEPLAYCSWGIDNLSIQKSDEYIEELKNWVENDLKSIKSLKDKNKEKKKFLNEIKYAQWKQIGKNKNTKKIKDLLPVIIVVLYRMPKIIREQGIRLYQNYRKILGWLVYMNLEKHEFIYFRGNTGEIKIRKFAEKNYRYEIINENGFDKKKTKEIGELMNIKEIKKGKFKEFCIIILIKDSMGRYVHYSIIYPNAINSPLSQTPLDKSKFNSSDCYFSTTMTLEREKGGVLNLLALQKIIEYCEKRDLSIVNLIHPSTKGAFKYYKTIGFTEIKNTNKINIYSKSKLNLIRKIKQFTNENL